MRVFFQTFGCKANQYDTELLRTKMESGGGVAIEDHRSADICVVNSCSVTATADRECRQFVRKLIRENPSARIVLSVACAGGVEGHFAAGGGLFQQGEGQPAGLSGV
jgi:threonylcarbamoyladenosine tRNA methylthiotransferase MtaB